MSLVKVSGIVIKQVDFGESNRILTIFTKEMGIINAVLYGAKSKRNKTSGNCQFLTYADFLLKTGTNDLYTIQSAEPIECFFKIAEDIVKLSLCVYFTDLVYKLININTPDENMLRLLLNSVYVLSEDKKSEKLVKAVFELRAMSYGGYMPNLACCSECFESSKPVAFSPKRGGIVCKKCVNAGDYYINSDVYNTLGYIITADEKRIFSFSGSDEVIKTISKISKDYVLCHCDGTFNSLEYYEKVSI